MPGMLLAIYQINGKRSCEMNVYRCWYQGTLGYGCRRGSNWMFVPELGQVDRRIYQDLALTELVFSNAEEMRFEMQNKTMMNSKSLGGWMGRIKAHRTRSRSVNGLLLGSH
jgi:hypothetical protein